MGFDVKCIPYIGSVPREYFCPVCQLLINPNEALQSMCGHLYCKPCLAYVASTTRACPYDGFLVTENDAKPLAESNKPLAETIGKTVVNCLYKNSGCTWLGSLSDSSSHCSECTFSSSLAICYWCGTQVAHRQGQEHVHVCPVMQQVQMQAYIQASIDVAASQASALGRGVAAATLTQDQWYQQRYHQYYHSYTGYFMHQQPLHLPGLAPKNANQHQVPYLQPSYQYVPQSYPQIQAQPQPQSQSLVLHQTQVASSAPQLGAASLPQAYPSVPLHPQHPSQTFPVSQGLQDLQAQAHSQTTPLSQAHHLTNSQVPQHHQFHGQIQNPMHPQAAVQNSPPKTTIDQCQSNQPHAYCTGHKLSPKPNQTNQVGVPPNNMPVSHQIGTQTPQVQNHFPQQVPQVRPLQSLPSMQKLPSKLTRAQVKQLVLKYGRSPVPESSAEVRKQGDEAIMDGTKAKLTFDSTVAVYGEKRAVEVTTTKFAHELKGKRIDESVHISNTFVEGNEIKSGSLGKQVMEENVQNCRANLGKSLLVEKNGTEDDPSLNGTPQLNHIEQDRLKRLEIALQNYLKTAYLDSENVEKSRASSSRSLDRGFDQRSPVRPHEMHEPDLELRPASRFSQPSTELGERQFRRGPRSPRSEHLGMPSHGSGTLDHGLGGPGAETTDSKGRHKFGLLRSEFKGHGNLQREKVKEADIIGPTDNNGLRHGDVRFRSRYTLQGFPGDGGSFSGDLGSVSNSRKRATGPVESIGLYPHTMDHQQKSMDMDVVIKQNAKKRKT